MVADICGNTTSAGALVNGGTTSGLASATSMPRLTSPSLSTAAAASLVAPGCATVGGATHCGEESFGLEQLIALLSEFPPANANPWAGGRIAREFVVDGSSVINHYTKGSGHGAAVHHVESGRVVASFWYGGESTAASPAASESGGSCPDAWAAAWCVSIMRRCQ